ncbi:MAG TPA: RNA-binding cell elongation regulator Jag/EloR [Clostridia bacterium]|nr:RNA-binding cell elongation regulator Jag/EloR [Clostridia bacterium]
MKSVEKTGRTVEEALELALIEMDLSHEDVEYEILENESKGFLGLFGTKEAKILVREKENIHHKAKEFLEDTLKKMNIYAKVEVDFSENGLSGTISGDNMSLVIGRRGKTLDALQYLTNLVINKDREKYVHLILDCEGYREKRKSSLEQLAMRMAEKAKRQRRDIILNPMNSYERRIVHSALQKDSEVSTRSEGRDPYRKVIIFLNR